MNQIQWSETKRKVGVAPIEVQGVYFFEQKMALPFCFNISDLIHKQTLELLRRRSVALQGIAE
jgi:hypothetical protein